MSPTYVGFTLSSGWNSGLALVKAKLLEVWIFPFFFPFFLIILLLSQQITDLKKENFNLKLRIYFLEERMQQKFDGPTEEVYKFVGI